MLEHGGVVVLDTMNIDDISYTKEEACPFDQATYPDDALGEPKIVIFELMNMIKR